MPIRKSADPEQAMRIRVPGSERLESAGTTITSSGEKSLNKGAASPWRGGEFPELLTQEGQLAVLAARPFAGCRAKRPVFPVPSVSSPASRQDGGGP